MPETSDQDELELIAQQTADGADVIAGIDSDIAQDVEPPAGH